MLFFNIFSKKNNLIFLRNYSKNTWFYIIVFLIILFGFLFFYLNNQLTETFENKDIPIDFYVITLGHENRLKNIETQQAKIKKPIVHIEAVFGDDLNLDDYDNIEPEFKSNERGRKRVIGCYMSHVKTYKRIKADGPDNGYSVLLEDDFTILPEIDDIEEKLKEMIRDLKEREFDLLFLENSSGNSGEEKEKGICLVEKDKPIYGNMALLIKNKSVDKLINESKIIKEPIDVVISKAIHENRLIAYTACPFLFNSRNEVSTINGVMIDPNAVFV